MEAGFNLHFPDRNSRRSLLNSFGRSRLEHFRLLCSEPQAEWNPDSIGSLRPGAPGSARAKACIVRKLNLMERRGTRISRTTDSRGVSRCAPGSVLRARRQTTGKPPASRPASWHLPVYRSWWFCPSKLASPVPWSWGWNGTVPGRLCGKGMNQGPRLRQPGPPGPKSPVIAALLLPLRSFGTVLQRFPRACARGYLRSPRSGWEYRPA